MGLRLWDRGSRDRGGEGHRNGDPDREPRVDQDQRAGGAAASVERGACAEQGAGAEERCGEEAAEEVVGTEDRIVPARRRTPGERGGAERVGAEPGAPGGELR